MPTSICHQQLHSGKIVYSDFLFQIQPFQLTICDQATVQHYKQIFTFMNFVYGISAKHVVRHHFYLCPYCLTVAS